MAKITRKTAKIFGSTAITDQIAEFGSLNAGSPAFSTDPAVIQSLSNWQSGWFAAVEDINSPAIEDMNAYCYVTSYQVGYLMQAGIAEWDSGTTYFIGSLVNDGSGNVYKSLTNNNLNNIVSSAVNWVNYLAGPFTAADGSAAAPTYSWSSWPTTGWFGSTGPLMNASIGGTTNLTLGSRNLRLGDSSTTAFLLGQPINTSSIRYCGGLTTTSSYLQIYGVSNGSFPNWFQFISSTASSYGSAIGSAGTWNFGNSALQDGTSLIRVFQGSLNTGVDQQGVLIGGNGVANTSATSSYSALMVDYSMSNVSMTMTGSHGFKMRDIQKGASQTVTNHAGVAIAQQSMTVGTSRCNLLVGAVDGVVLSPSVAGTYSAFFDGTGTVYFKSGLTTAGNIASALDSTYAIGAVNNLFAQVFSVNYLSGNNTMNFQTSNSSVVAMSIDINQNVAMNNAAVTTTATNGFLYIATCAGTPTGVPTSKTGRSPIVYDTSANKIWFYNGSWRGIVVV